MRYDLNEKKEVVRLNEDKDKAGAIRSILKDKFGLNSRDVGVRSENAGYSTSINVTIKSAKALPYYNEIEEIANSKKSVRRDERSYEILSGGNTFIFVDLDYKFDKKVIDKVWEDMQKEATPEFLNPENHNTGVMKMYGEVSIFNIKGRFELNGIQRDFPAFDRFLAQYVWGTLVGEPNYKKIIKKYFRSL